MKILVFALSAAPIFAQASVEIADPNAGDQVSGIVSIAGTSTGLVNGRVMISVDGGPFRLAQGTANWTYSWDSTAVGDGPRQIRARARECFSCTPAFDQVAVEVVNNGGLSVEIEQPSPGSTLFGTIVVTGSSSGANEVLVSVDGGAEELANGINPFDVVLEASTLGPGAHTVVARVNNGTTEVTDSVSFEVGSPPAGAQEFTYLSSVDGTAMTSELWLPSGFDENGPAVPLVVHLHGGGGIGQISADMQAQLDARGWIGIAPDGREWGIFGGACTWRFSSAYVDSFDRAVGPGERDIFDAIDWARANLPIDVDRIYLTGFSMGGRGTYAIGLKNPDRFAAIAPMGPASEMFEVWVRRTNPGDCKEGMMGGPPGTSALVDTMHQVTSARFLVENAFNLPVYHAHGLLDAIASNTTSVSEYLHGWHMTNDVSFDACHDGSAFCFGHTPTLSELSLRHPSAYDWAYMFTPVGHVTDGLWLTGAPAAPERFGTEDPLNAGQLVGIYDFFERRTLVHSPEVVVYKTYEDQHQGAYWAGVVSSAPWSTQPAAIRATRDVVNNVVTVEVSRAEEVRIDAQDAGLDLSAAAPLSVVLARLEEPVYDPALSSLGEALTPRITITAASVPAGATALVDGAIVDPASVQILDADVMVGPVDVVATHTVDIHVGELYCSGAAGGGGTMGYAGTASVMRNDFVLTTANAAPSQLGLYFYGFGEADVPFGDGRLCIGGQLFRTSSPAAINGAGDASRPLDLTVAPAASGAGAITAGVTARFQFWYRDPSGPSGFTVSNAMRVTFLP